jgi:membrane protein implicated in regulation of membrane protease activity
MLVLYLSALVLGGGIVVVQVAMGGHGADHDASGTHDADHDASFWSFIASVRFWAFTLFAFGLVGALVTIFGFAVGSHTLVISSLAGFVAGYTAVSVVRRLTHNDASSHSTSADVVGRVGRVLVAPTDEGRGKVRIDLKGGVIDYVARARGPVAEGDIVLVEEVDGAEVVVSRAPKELEP